MIGLWLTEPSSFVRNGGSLGLANIAPDNPVWVKFARAMVRFITPIAGMISTEIAAWPTTALRDRSDRCAAPGAATACVLVVAGEPAVADHIRDQNRRNFPGLAYGKLRHYRDWTKTRRNPPVSILSDSAEEGDGSHPGRIDPFEPSGNDRFLRTADGRWVVFAWLESRHCEP
jgi:hypothetical protein